MCLLSVLFGVVGSGLGVWVVCQLGKSQQPKRVAFLKKLMLVSGVTLILSIILAFFAGVN